MKDFSIILSIVSILFTVVQLADSCSKDVAREKDLQFREWVSRIERQSDSLMAYQLNTKDSLNWMLEHRRKMEKALDSPIQYYRNNYAADEVRYKPYLEILYEYKKLSYLYADWIRSCRTMEDSSKTKDDFHPLTFQEFQRKKRLIQQDLTATSFRLLTID